MRRSDGTIGWTLFHEGGLSMKIKNILSMISGSRVGARDDEGIITPLESRILLSHTSSLSQEYLIGHADEELSDEIYKKFLELVERRKKDEPIAYIIGKKEFYGRDFKVTKDVLIPRPDSEVLIDTVLTNNSRHPQQHRHHGESRDDDRTRNDDKIKILELGIGSGCLLLTLLSAIPTASGLGVDISEAALKIAQENAISLNLKDRCELRLSDWFKNVTGKYDIIISNPPYIHESETSVMAPETIKYEPHLALFGGLDPYKIIASEAHKFLAEDGYIYVEIGYKQSSQIIEIFEKHGYKVTQKHQDIEQRDRVLVFVLASI